MKNSQSLGSDMFTAKLLIRGFTEEDSKKEYLFEVQNEFGTTMYTVRLSMDEAPQGKYMKI